MRKVLLASSALVGASVLAAAPALADATVNGFVQWHLSAADQDVDNPDRGYDFVMNNEAHVNASTTADNGLTFGVHIEFEADTNATANTDEANLFITGSFGRLEFGDQDGAGDQSMVNGSSVGFNYGGVGNLTGSIVNANSGSAKTSADWSDSSDSTKVTYYTPTFSGFRAGVSFAPDSGSNGTNVSDDSTGGIGDFVEGGVKYSGEFGGFGIAAGLSGGFGTQDGTDNDFFGYGGGLMVSFAGFSAAVGYVQDDTDNGAEPWAFDAGLGFETGPWNAHVGAIWSEDDAGPADFNQYHADVGYSIAPGLGWYASVTTGSGTNNAGADNDFTAFQTGLTTSF